jgi:arabinogalactan oligomer/maltooligosaccharide transport system substrate-binding protein
MPYVSEAIALYYNKDLVTTVPTTWDDLKAQATAFQGTDTTKQGICMQKGDPYHTYPLLTGFGGYIFGKNADGSYNPQDVGLDSTGGLAYAKELDDMVKAGLLRDNVDFGACETSFLAGKSEFWITGPWELKKFQTSGIHYGVAPIPMMPKQPRPFVGVQGFMVSAFAKNKTEAETFLTEYIATDDVMKQLWTADPRLPVWKQLQAQTDLLGPDIAAFTQSASNGDPMPAIPEMSKVWDAWTKAINLVYTQQQDSQTAFKDAATTIRGLIGQ